MCVLSDRSIREEIEAGRLVITPYEPANVQPASVDLRLGHEFVVGDGARGEWDVVYLQPGEFCLATTIEVVRLPDDVVGRLDGRSSLGRMGLMVHATAGYIDPGFEGEITLELSNVSDKRIQLEPGMRVGQISFMRMTTPVERPYGSPGLGSKYQGQRGPTESRFEG